MKMKINTPIGELWLDADQNGLTKVSFHPIEEMAVNGAQDQGKNSLFHGFALLFIIQ